jgi:hypothetical protein
MSITRFLGRNALLLAALALGAMQATAADMRSFEAVYDLRLTHASASRGPRAATGVYEMRSVETCDGWDTKSRIVLDLAFRDDSHSNNERFFSSWESKSGHDYRFAVRTVKNGKVVEAYKGTASLSKKGGTAQYEIPPASGDKKPRLFKIALPRDTLFPAAHSRALLERAESGAALFSSVVLNGGASNGPRVMSVAIGPRQDSGDPEVAGSIDRALLGTPSWRMSSAFFNLNERRDTPNTEMFLRLNTSGVTHSFEQTFSDFTVAATLKSLKPIAPPACK